MLIIADESKLYLVEFYGRKNLEQEISLLTSKRTIITGETKATLSVKKELELYFKGKLKHFSTPIHLQGTPFQKCAWNALLNIPYGSTINYGEQAANIDNPKGFRAVANANSKNQFAIIVPCHRVINKCGKLGGYAGGIEKKKWLLHHELNI